MIFTRIVLFISTAGLFFWPRNTSDERQRHLTHTTTLFSSNKMNNAHANNHDAFPNYVSQKYDTGARLVGKCRRRAFPRFARFLLPLLHVPPLSCLFSSCPPRSIAILTPKRPNPEREKRALECQTAPVWEGCFQADQTHLQNTIHE